MRPDRLAVAQHEGLGGLAGQQAQRREVAHRVAGDDGLKGIAQPQVVAALHAAHPGCRPHEEARAAERHHGEKRPAQPGDAVGDRAGAGAAHEVDQQDQADNGRQHPAGRWTPRRRSIHNRRRMASVSLHVPVAIILLAGGLVSCFFGYRLLRVLLAAYGFVGGIILAVQFGGDLELWATVLLTAGAGVAGAILAIVAYLAGVALLGAASGALALNAVWTSETGEPGLWLLLGVCLAGALAALVVRRYVIIIGASVSGAWAALVGGAGAGRQQRGRRGHLRRRAANVPAGARGRARGICRRLVRAGRRGAGGAVPLAPQAGIARMRFDPPARHSLPFRVCAAADPHHGSAFLSSSIGRASGC